VSPHVSTYQAEAALAQALIAAIPTMYRHDITVIGPCDDSHTECAQAITVLLSPDEANQLTALIQLAQGNPGGICLVCGCPLANLRCGHTCCCSGGQR